LCLTLSFFLSFLLKVSKKLVNALLFGLDLLRGFFANRSL
jgi:hypothetical protein